MADPKPRALASARVNRSVRRVLDILEQLSVADAPRMARQLASATGHAYTTVVADLKSLHALGYANFDPIARTYAPSIRMSLLGSAAAESARLTEDLKQWLGAVADATDETVVVAQQRGSLMEAIYVVPGGQPLTLTMEVGFTLPVVGSALGRAWQMGVQRVETSAEQPVVAVIDQQEMLASFRRGYAVAYDGAISHVGAVAVPIQIVVGRAREPEILAVSVGGVTSRIRNEEAEIARRLLGKDGQRFVVDARTA